MERPWGLSGPEFLELYWIALAVSLAYAVFVRVRLRGTGVDAPAGVLGVLDIAYLTGGPRRVVEASVAGLIHSGALVPARNGSVRIAGSPVAEHPVDQAVLADANRYRYRTLALLFTSAAEHDAPRAVGRRLSELDYVVAPETVKRRLRAGVVPMVALFAVGVVRWVNGLVIDAPVGWLTFQLVLTGVLVWVLLKAAPKIMLTAKGRDAVAKARASEATGGWGGTGSANPAEPVALGGFAGHPDVTLRATARPRRPRARAGSSGAYAAGSYGTVGCGSAGGSSCSSGGSSCGGGGCGGGGS